MRGPYGGGGLGAVKSVIPIARFASGGLWDARDIGGAQPANIAAPWSNPASANLATPSAGATPPQIWDRSVGALRSAHIRAIPPDYGCFIVDELAPLFQGPPVPFAFLIKWRPMQAAQASLFCLMRNVGGAPAEALMLRFEGSRYSYTKITPGGGTTQAFTAFLQNPTDDCIAGWQFNGSRMLFYYQGIRDALPVKTDLGAFPLDAFSNLITRGTIGATRSSVPYEGNTGDIQKTGVALTLFSDAEWATLFSQLRAENYYKSPLQSPAFVESGDSLTVGVNDLWPSGAGPVLTWRGPLAQFIRDNGLSFFSTATPPIATGTGTGNCLTSAFSGQDISQITALTLNDIATATTAPGFVSIFMGDGNNNNGESAATFSAKWLVGARQIIAAAKARNPNCLFLVTTLPPISPIGGPQDLRITASLPLYAANFATLQAENPGQVYAWDAHSALGGVWTAQCFGADTGHPNHYGSVQMALDPTYGTLNAVNENNEKFGVALRRLSTSASSPIAATIAITSPAPGASIAHGSVTITVSASRLGGRGVVTLGSQSGPIVWTDYFTAVTAIGGSAVTPNYQGSVTLAIPIGDVGPRTVQATFTDIDGVTTANATPVNVTIT